MKKIIEIILLIFAILLIILILSVFIIDIYVKSSTKKNIIDIDDISKYKVDAIIILGCKVNPNGNPSDMLADRLNTGIKVYNLTHNKIIMSGDHGRDEYDEVNIMKKYAIDKGIPSSDIFMDHAGFSTYETMYRAKEIFGVKKAIIVTQEYHLYRSLYIAKKLGIEAVGVNADVRRYFGQTKRDIREVLARYKDFFKIIIKPKPTYLGEVIPVTGNGDVTNDK